MGRAPGTYLRTRRLYPPLIGEPPHPELGLVVVIPCHDEPDLLFALAALRRCDPPGCAVEVIVVINAAAGSGPEVAARNARSLADAERWCAEQAEPRFRVFPLSVPELPARQAGVGLARKIGMDEAAARLDDVGNSGGVIAGFDADCGCEPNYLQCLERFFGENPRVEAASVYFEHRLEPALEPAIREGIILYELYLRYFNLGLKHSGHPFAYHTLGSSMAVRGDAYQGQGGMNRRQAGEDFYFLGKFMAIGRFGEIRDTTVFPSPRTSHRVPFGTGKAMTDWLAGPPTGFPVFHPQIFADLRVFLSRVPDLYAPTAPEPLKFLAGLPRPVAEFLEEGGFADRLAELRRNSGREATFRKRFFRWFHRLQVLKFAHFATARTYPKIPVEQAARTMLGWVNGRTVEGGSAEALLTRLREMERAGFPPPEKL